MILTKLRKLTQNIYAILSIYFWRILWKNKNNCEIHGIVFSMNRPLQIYALLESYFVYCKDPAPLTIIYKATNKVYKNAYKEIEDYFCNYNLIFIEEDNFKSNLITTLSNLTSEYIFFLVDDIIFKAVFSFKDFIVLPDRDRYIVSLRLGKNLNFCYTKGQNQALPDFKKIGLFFIWSWRRGVHDWHYVFSVDGNLYERHELLIATKLVDFEGPNSFEANLNTLKYFFRRKSGICYSESKLINVVLNRVQKEIPNRSGKFITQELLEIWRKNKKIDIFYFHEIKNASAHIEINNLPLTVR